MNTSVRVGVITFPGSNGDHDAFHALRDDLGYDADLIDYRSTELDALDAVVLPGGFSYGDALRAGAIARFSPVMPALRDFARSGRPVLGICNGFQILCEAHLLPGALLRNKSLRFQCFWTHIRIEQTTSVMTKCLDQGEVLRLPVAHGEGSYFIDAEALDKLERNEQIVARYCNAAGVVGEVSNPNGSLGGIAAISNEAGNVVGLMPHPERATNRLTGGDNGIRLLRQLASAVLAEPVVRTA